jgi:orotidine-5'-phosphate decarboxylase
MAPFSDRLAEAVCRTATVLCVGIDPRYESLPRSIRDRFPVESLEAVAHAYGAFASRILELVAGRVAVVKPQMAFFEACGPAGLTVLQDLLRQARSLGLLTILDGKRGDIASTATAYADAALGGVTIAGRTFPVWDADALTINPYLGADAVEPFLVSARRAGRGTFVLVRTSNPGSGVFQELDCHGRPLYRHVAEAVANWSAAQPGASGLGDVGLVVGATHPAELAELRQACPNVWFLVPGYGAQGGGAAEALLARRPDGLGALVNSSRGVTFPFDPEEPEWEKAIRLALNRGIADLPT